jgi:hypothetical protein
LAFFASVTLNVVTHVCSAFLSLPPPLTREPVRHSLSKANNRRDSESLPMSKKRSSPVRPPPRAERPPPSDGRPKNRLLASLPADDYRRLLPLLTTVPIRVKQVLHKNGEALRAVYFLNGGVASITSALSDGTTVEAATVGDEGMLGTQTRTPR